MQETWCVLGDFNAVLASKDIIGGEDIQYIEIADFKACLEDCELTEIRSTDAYYTWTNKTVWSRIDRIVANSYWYNVMDYTHVKCEVQGLSNHTMLQLAFPISPRCRTLLCSIRCGAQTHCLRG